METLFQNGSTARQPDPEKIQAELYEQLGRLQMELAWVKKICLVRWEPRDL